MVEGKGWTSEEILCSLVSDLNQLIEVAEVIGKGESMGRLELDQLRAGVNKAMYWINQGRVRCGYTESDQGEADIPARQDDSRGVARGEEVTGRS
jgi:hypothetical protein